MSRLIDADVLIEKIRKLPNAGVRWFVSAEAVFDTILNAPTIEPRSGKWVEIPDDIFAPIVVCSRCNQLAIVDLYGEYQRTRYCSNCGARMVET